MNYCDTCQKEETDMDCYPYCLTCDHKFCDDCYDKFITTHMEDYYRTFCLECTEEFYKNHKDIINPDLNLDSDLHCCCCSKKMSDPYDFGCDNCHKPICEQCEISNCLTQDDACICFNCVEKFLNGINDSNYQLATNKN